MDNTMTQFRQFLANLYLKTTGSPIDPNDPLEVITQRLCDHFDRLIACMPGNIYWLDKHSRFLGCNNNVAKMLGLKSPADIKGLSHADTAILLNWKHGQAESFSQDDQKVVKTGEIQVNIEEPPIWDAQGNPIVFLTTRVPLKNEQNETVGVVGNSVDISDRKRMEKDLEVAKQLAQAASKAKSDFIANMSHDIRTPITGMIGLLQDLMDTAQSTRKNIAQKQFGFENQIEFVGKVENHSRLLTHSIDELLQLCNQILETVNLESGKVSEKEVSFSVRERVSHIVDLLRPVAEHRTLGLFTTIDPAIPLYVKGLCTYFDRILLNLVSNALKFTQHGFVDIIVNLVTDYVQPTGKILLELRVKDTGMGIPKEKFETIFEYFTRLTPAYDGVYKGSGLGLYTVKQYLQAMSGKIRVESVIGNGTEFTVQIPFTLSDHNSHVKQSIRPLDPPLVTNTTGHVLVVEDNPMAAIAVKGALMRHGCTVEVAVDGDAGVKKAQEQRYDLILMDIGLPSIDGLEATRRIRALSNPVLSQVPIVALTGHLDKREECLNAGMHDLLMKPAQPQLLEAILKRYVFGETIGAPTTSSLTKENHVPDEAAIPSIDWNQSLQMIGGNMNDLKKLLAVSATEIMKTQSILEKTYNAKDTLATRAELHRCLGGVCYLRLPRLESALKMFQAAVKREPKNPDELHSTYQSLQEAMQAFFSEYKRMEAGFSASVEEPAKS